MKRTTFITCISLSLATHTALAQNSANGIKSLSWLIGTWTASLGTKGTTYEVWSLENDSTLRAKSFLVKATGDTVPNEKLRLIYRNKKLIYESTVSGQNNNLPVPFVISTLTKNGFTAENPAHDFPQRIYYLLESSDHLNASIEGTFNGKFRKKEYPMDRIK